MQSFRKFGWHGLPGIRLTSCVICKSSQNVLRTMAELAPKAILPKVMNYCMSCLAKPAFQQVTLDEFAIMNTPEGDIYNKSVLERLVFASNVFPF